MKKYIFSYSGLFILLLGMMWWIISKGKKLVPHYVSDTVPTVPANPVKQVSSLVADSPVRLILENLKQPVSHLLMQIIVILVVARLFGVIASKLRFQSVVGEMIAGIFLGPSIV